MIIEDILKNITSYHKSKEEYNHNKPNREKMIVDIIELFYKDSHKGNTYDFNEILSIVNKFLGLYIVNNIDNREDAIKYIEKSYDLHLRYFKSHYSRRDKYPMP